ncbi:MAG: methyltransferase domain-containing protein [Dehalococcoidia bacterium]
MTESSEHGRLSLFRDTADISETDARDLAARLEHRGQAEDETTVREEYLRLLGLAPGERVLDLGCGTGVVTRAIAERVAPDGQAIGVDTSPALLAMAREYADAAGTGGLVRFEEGDCRALSYADASFDVVIAATVLAHVPDAERALAEMVRVTRPGGRLGVFDFDGDSFLVSHPDRELTRRIMASFSDNTAVNGWLARQLPGLLLGLGLTDVRVRAFLPLEREEGSFHAGLAERAAGVAAQVSAITSVERDRWLDELHSEIAAGNFLGGRLHLFAWGTRAPS